MQHTADDADIDPGLSGRSADTKNLAISGDLISALDEERWKMICLGVDASSGIHTGCNRYFA